MGLRSSLPIWWQTLTMRAMEFGNDSGLSMVRKRVVCLHAPEDAAACLKLLNQLRPVIDQCKLDVWHPGLVGPGEERDQRAVRVHESDLVLLLVSEDFFADGLLYDVCQWFAKDPNWRGRVVPVLLRPCAWEETALGGFQPLPRNCEAISVSRNQDEARAEIARELAEVVRALPAQRSAAPLHQNPRPKAMPLRLRAGRREDLLERVVHFCERRERRRQRTAHTMIREGGPFDHFAEVVVEDHGRVHCYGLAAMSGTPSVSLIAHFQDEVAARYQQGGQGSRSVLVYGGELPSTEVRRAAYQAGIELHSLLAYQGLLDFTPYRRWLEGYLKDTAGLYPPALYVAQQMSRWEGGGRVYDNALEQIYQWLTEPGGRLLVLLADFGTGKTFLLRQLAQRMLSEGVVTPLFLQMRELEKSHSFKEIIGGHLAGADMEYDPEAFEHMLRDGQVALLFDGFDELAVRVDYDGAAHHLDTVIQAARSEARLIMTSRTQHFRSDEDARTAVRTALGERLDTVPHRLLRLHKFGLSQIRVFLRNQRLQNDSVVDEAVLDAHIQLLGEDLLGLAETPRMLAFIADLPREALLNIQQKRGRISSAGLYEEVVERWMRFEEGRGRHKGAQSGLSAKMRLAAVTELALRMWERGARFVKLGEISQHLAAVLATLEAIPPRVALHQIGSGTLLCRDEEGQFSFMHLSVQEWLVARAAAAELRADQPAEVLGLGEMSQLMADFLIDLAGPERVARWVRGVLVGSATERARDNALLMKQRLPSDVQQKVETRRIVHNVALIGMVGSGKTATAKRLEDPSFVDFESLVGTGRMATYQRSIKTATNPRTLIPTEHIFRVFEWGGEYLVEAQTDMLRMATLEESELRQKGTVALPGIQVLIFVVDLASPLPYKRNSIHVYDPDRIRRQIENYFSPKTLPFLLNNRTLQYINSMVLFINKLDALEGPPESCRAQAMELFGELRSALELRYQELEVIVGSAKTGEGLDQLYSHLVKKILPAEL